MNSKKSDEFVYEYVYGDSRDGEKQVIGCNARLKPSFLKNRMFVYDPKRNAMVPNRRFDYLKGGTE